MCCGINTSLGLYNVRGSVNNKTEILFLCWFLFGSSLVFWGVVVVGFFGTVCGGDLINKQYQCELD